MHDTAAVALMIERIKKLEGIIEEHLGIQEYEVAPLKPGFGIIFYCPICGAEATSVTSSHVKHDPNCYWAEER